MSIVKSYQTSQPGNQIEQSTERARIARLMHIVAAAGVRVDPATIINCYVSLKSKPLNILVGPPQSGKTAFIQSLAHVLAGESLRCQVMDGHAWWAGHTGDVARFTEAHTRFTTAKILALIEEALLPENANRVFIACLTKISPAELNGYFSEVAYQLRHGQIMRLPGAHLTEPISYPPNLFLLGTMDSVDRDWSDKDLLSKANIIYWPTVETQRKHPMETIPDCQDGDTSFLKSCIRSENNARRQLHLILGNICQVIDSLTKIEGFVEQLGFPLTGSVTDQALVYLANAWSPKGAGLFDENPANNLVIAMDFAITQTFLPYIVGPVKTSMALVQEFQEVLQPFPHSAAYLNDLTYLFR